MTKTITKILLKKLYTGEGYTIKDLARYFSVSTSTIRRALKEHSIPLRVKKPQELKRIVIDESELRSLYLNNQSLTKIAGHFGCSKRTISRWVGYLNFPKRSIDKVLSMQWSSERRASIKRDSVGRLITGDAYSIDFEYQSSSSVIKRAKRIRGDKCNNCGWNKATVDGHHLVSIKDGGKHTVENIILLCPNCHRLKHLGKI